MMMKISLFLSMPPSPTKRKKTTQIVTKNDEEGPVVYSFPGGVPPKEPEWRWKDEALMGRDDACVYASGAPDATRLTKLCVGIYDKRKNTLTVQLAHGDGHVYTLRQSVPAYQSQTNSNLSGAEHRKALFEDFGSSKKRKVLRSQEANRVNVESVIGSGSLLMSSVLMNNESTNGEATVDPDTAWRQSFLPKFNDKAQEPHQVYQPKEMAGEEAWSAIRRMVDACLQKDDVITAITRADDPKAAKDWLDSTRHLLEKVPLSSPNARSALSTIVLCNAWAKLYAQLHWKRHIPAVDEAKGRYFGVSLPLAQRFLSLFGTPNGDSYVLSKPSQDRCRLYICLLYCLSIPKANLHALSHDLQVDVKDMGHLLRLAGWTVQKQATQTTAVLKLPVTFPSTSRGPPARGR